MDDVTAEPVVRNQRLGAYAWVVEDDRVLLTRISPRGYDVGSWTLPGGGVDHGESPRVGVVREVREEAGLDVEVTSLLDVHDVHFTGRNHAGVLEDYHGVHLVFGARVVGEDREPRVLELDGTTDAARWVPLDDVRSHALPVLALVDYALASAEGEPPVRTGSA